MLLQRTRRFPFSLGLAIAATTLIANACSSDDDDDSTSRGGSTSAGGKSAGGSTAKGGTTGKGGTSGTTGGAATTGGQAGETSGGSGPAGGATAEGGAIGTTGGQGGQGGAAGSGEGGAAGNAALESYVALLSGAEEVPPVATSAVGAATLTYDPSTRMLSWTVAQNVVNATAAHIHDAAPGENGAVIIPFSPVGSVITGSAELTLAQEADLRLGHLYTNVHSPGHASGEIRGQILRPGESLWVAQLKGAEEVPANTSTGTGVASLIVNATHTTGHYRLTTSLTPTAAHIHTGIAGVSGPVRFPFTLSGSTAEGDIALSAADFTALEQTQLYANVHTTALAAGEIRGQLLHPGSSLYVAKLTGDQEVPPVVSTGTGNASAVLEYDGVTLHYALTTSLTPTAAHIHTGIAGVSGPVTVPFANPATAIFGTATVDTDTAAALAEGSLYANVHTVTNSGGEIRGQLLGPGEKLYTATLTGASEVPPVVTTATGNSQFILNAAGTSLRYSSVVTGLADATQSHIHSGAVGIAGDVVYPLTLVGLNPIGSQDVVAADVTNLNASLYYVNIHSTANPSGEIRGQIIPR